MVEMSTLSPYSCGVMSMPSVLLVVSCFEIHICLPVDGSSANSLFSVAPYSRPYPSATPFGPPDGVTDLYLWTHFSAPVLSSRA